MTRLGGQCLFQEAFHHRSGRLISLGRLVLATVFLLAIWLDPSQPTRAPGTTYSLLGAYMILAAGHFAATWNNSWLDWRLAMPSHVLDIAMFALLVFLTDGYTSPFFTHFIFIILSATIRWGWLETALTALTVNSCGATPVLGAPSFSGGRRRSHGLTSRNSTKIHLSKTGSARIPWRYPSKRNLLVGHSSSTFAHKRR